MIDPEATDSELVAGVLGGDEQAFTALMRRHKSWLYLFIRRHTPTSDDAYDILQETFASAWRAMQRYDRDRSLETWLRRIALNKCRDKGRKEAVRRRVFAFVGAPAAMVEEVPDIAPDAERAQIASETLKRLDAALARLPAHLREPLVLTSLQGLSQREAAEVLGVGVKVVEMRVYRARKLLAAALQPTDGADLGSG